jgi:cyclophilin family peptidyl-prolyl cis-trans isomerase
MKAILKTNHGDIIIQLLDQQTPNTVTNFVKLAKEGFYDGIKFYRVIKDFMIQGGDPLTKDDTKMAHWGTGGQGYKFDDEITAENDNGVGTISMANAGRNTNGSQFFINLRDNNFLNSKHTAFGRVTAGMDIAKLIEGAPTGAGDRPLEHIVINTIIIDDEA